MVHETSKTMAEFPYRYVHRPDYLSYDFGGGHAFDPIRQELTLDLVQKSDLLPAGALDAGRPARDEEIALFHTDSHIRAVREVGSGAPVAAFPFHGLGTMDNPAFSGMHEATAARVGGTLHAVRGVMEGRFRHAANFGGGLHHAFPDRASGFCIYNDIGVAIAWLRKTYNARVAYVDLDAHHGDGVQWGFYDDPDVLTVSIHESGRFLFPGTGDVDEIGDGDGLGTSVNVPLAPHTTSASWLECFDAVVPDVLEAFAPDILITQHGCDAHRFDPLTHLAVSVQTLDRAARRLHRLAHDLCGGRWVALGGGGYSVWQVVPRAWGLVWAALIDREPPHEIPEAWIAAWKERAPVVLPTHWLDMVDQPPPKDGADIEDEWRSKENLSEAVRSRKTALRYLKKRRVRTRGEGRF